MAVSMMSSASVAARITAPVQSSSLMSSFTPTKKVNGGRASNAGRIKCMKKPFIYRENGRTPGYYDGRYWTMWKLPMFGCTDSSQVLKEVDECVKEYENAFVRIIGFDNVRQVQCISFIAHKPAGY